MACIRSLLVALVAVAAVSAEARSPDRSREGALLQTWGKTLDAAAVTPITRVVNLLKEMQHTLEKEMAEDEELYDKLACWCNNNNYEKTNAIEAGQSKIEQLESSIEQLTAKSGELATTIKELEAEFAADKESLAKATEMRERQLKEFHGGEVDSIQAIENLKAALVVLSKHHAGAFPQFTASLMQTGHASPWGADHESSLERSLDAMVEQDDVPAPKKQFLQQADASATAATDTVAPWSAQETAVVQKAIRAASAFVQRRHGGEYFPSYSSQSGEIVGVLNGLKDEMESALGESQKTEMGRAANFAELRTAKEAEIANGEKMAEKKEDQLADTNNALAEAKEDLEQSQAALSENQKFLKNLGETCKDADVNFQTRKNARMEEIKAVSETVEILMSDDARDASAATFKGFIQLSVRHKRVHSDSRRQQAAAVLRRAAAASGSPELSVLASTVELDAFSRVKKAIDDMVSTLKIQQADEVKKNDWCGVEFQNNDMTTAKTEDHRADLEATIGTLDATMKQLTEDTANAHAQIAQLHLDLQRATENRKQENFDFQKTIADQRATTEVLGTALDRLATYYDQADLLQKSHKQTPPVPQAEYKPSAGASGVMQMIEKLIHEAKGLEADSRKSEQDAQAAYETLVADTNGSVGALQKEVVTKTQDNAQARKEKQETEGDLKDAVDELEGLGKYNGSLHAECDYVQKNFNARQEARGQEIEALQQAKQILSGANLS